MISGAQQLKDLPDGYVAVLSGMLPENGYSDTQKAIPLTIFTLTGFEEALSMFRY